MRVITLDEEQIGRIYNERMLDDFPKDELKPLKNIYKMINQNNYTCYGFIDDDESIAGYAFILNSLGGRLCILDYLAVDNKQRRLGIGNSFLKKVLNKCNQSLLIEVENPEFAGNDAVRDTCEKRIDFYKKAGAELTNVESCVFGVEYKLMVLCKEDDNQLDELTIFTEYKRLYKYMVNEENYKKFVEVRFNVPPCIL